MEVEGSSEHDELHKIKEGEEDAVAGPEEVQAASEAAEESKPPVNMSSEIAEVEENGSLPEKNQNDVEPMISQNNNDAAVEVGNEVGESNEELPTTSEDDVEQLNVEAISKRTLTLTDILDKSSQTDSVLGEEMQNDIE